MVKLFIAVVSFFSLASSKVFTPEEELNLKGRVLELFNPKSHIKKVFFSKKEYLYFFVPWHDEILIHMTVEEMIRVQHVSQADTYELSIPWAYENEAYEIFPQIKNKFPYVKFINN